MIKYILVRLKDEVFKELLSLSCKSGEREKVVNEEKSREKE